MSYQDAVHINNCKGYGLFSAHVVEAMEMSNDILERGHRRSFR